MHLWNSSFLINHVASDIYGLSENLKQVHKYEAVQASCCVYELL